MSSKSKQQFTRDIIKNPNVSVGEYTYGTPRIYSWDSNTRLSIGKFCSIADDVKLILGGNHRTDWVSTYPFSEMTEYFPGGKTVKGHPQTKGDIKIGNDVWIGNGVAVLSGVTVGDGAVLGAYSVITKDVKPYEIVVGNPMQVVRKRFSDAQIDALLKIKWWEWNKEQIDKNVPELCSSNIDEFIKKWLNKA